MNSSRPGKLLDRVRDVLRVKHYSYRTKQDEQVAAATQNQALSAIAFLYRFVLQQKCKVRSIAEKNCLTLLGNSVSVAC